eukprot:gnl/MRDRNA2_/MRDRNA2_14698_c0_seq2.p1 gnl/MRDRNA2_/MRDRNA2_14698_c0~~gnl/MRDRNA2_/MRDRNA2_14698_c0_seq2.p1  ORF type:complete len:639 (-),score=91.70 gnl/MRDRNA2_/MRDRNA2_14698_c0_seq2:45-1961(-)
MWFFGFVLFVRARADPSPYRYANTSSGVVRGLSRSGMKVFRGIPYAAPPIRDLRWSPPQRHLGWNGTRDAFDFGPTCVRPKCWDSDNVTVQNEDCLTINVISPDREGQFPVMVYIHAGEFHCGSSNDAESAWPYFTDDITFVSFNYRLGVFGFLAADELRPRAANNGTGNYGLLDQRFAFQWVKENIAAFGGNASNVAIWGESSGGTGVGYHILSKDSQPGKLFQKGILQSPGMTQVKTWEAGKQNFQWLLSRLSAANSPNCSRSPGYDSFVSDFMGHTPLHSSDNDTLEEAMAWCDSNSTCHFFERDHLNHTQYYSNYIQIFDLETLAGSANNVAFAKRGPVEPEERLHCLTNANASLLNMLTFMMPRDDTFASDCWAPVIDGVDMPKTLVEMFNDGGVSANVDLLIGTNLDEGTEFMYLTPPLRCNANATELQTWMNAFYGQDVGQNVLPLYSSLERPLPACGSRHEEAITGEEALYFNTAMRSAGDAAIRCVSENLALSAHGKVFVYRFSLTPSYSVNFPNTTVMGSFHGAEVPFALGDTFELLTAEERYLAGAMGCYWRSFAYHGDPSVDACNGVPWPAFSDDQSFIMDLGSTIRTHLQTDNSKQRCKLFAQLFQAQDHMQKVKSHQLDVPIFI